MSKRVVIFNGPPGCGKDYGVKALAAIGTDSKLVVTHNKMAEPLKAAVHKLFSLNHDPVHYDLPTNAAQKDVKLVKLFGMSPREAYIWLSEEVMKPTFGRDVFGQMAVNVMSGQNADVHAYSDGGFVEELLPIVDYVGASNVLVIEVHATKAGLPLTFDGDSRSYIGDALTKHHPNVTVRRIYNEFGGIHEQQFYRMMVVAAVKKFLGIEDAS